MLEKKGLSQSKKESKSKKSTIIRVSIKKVIFNLLNSKIKFIKIGLKFKKSTIIRNATVSYDKFLDWASFNEVPDIKNSPSKFFEELKLKHFITFEERFFSATLVKEFYLNIALGNDELSNLKKFIEEKLNVLLRGKKFTIIASDLGNLLKKSVRLGNLRF